MFALGKQSKRKEPKGKSKESKETKLILEKVISKYIQASLKNKDQSSMDIDRGDFDCDFT